MTLSIFRLWNQTMPVYQLPVSGLYFLLTENGEMTTANFRELRCQRRKRFDPQTRPPHHLAQPPTLFR
jgi:hypothetical protein